MAWPENNSFHFSVGKKVRAKNKIDPHGHQIDNSSFVFDASGFGQTPETENDKDRIRNDQYKVQIGYRLFQRPFHTVNKTSLCQIPQRLHPIHHLSSQRTDHPDLYCPLLPCGKNR